MPQNVSDSSSDVVRSRQWGVNKMETTIRDVNPVEVTNFMTDKYVSRILLGTYKRPRSIQYLSESYNIPIAVCYRRVHDLERAGFITCTGNALNQKGKRVKLFQSLVRSAHFFYEQGQFRARVQLSSGHIDDCGGVFTLDQYRTPIAET